MDEAEPAKRGRREVIAAPRGNAKTTFKVLFKVLHAIVYGYEKFIVIIGYSAPEAEKKVKEILEELENNNLLQEIYSTLAPVRGKNWGTKDFITQNGIRILAKSRGKQVRGIKHGPYRPSLVILDDIEAPEKVLKESQRQKTKDWFEKDILKLGPANCSHNVIVIGTCLHPEALLPQLLTSPGWMGRKYQAIQSFARNQELWTQWKTIYTDLSNPKREIDAQAFYDAHDTEMLIGVEVLWPTGESYLQLMKMIINEGQASFQSEKQNDPYDPERQIFDMNNAKRFKLEYDSNGKVAGFRWLDGSNRIVREIEKIVAFHDPAMASTKESDFAAIVVCAKDLNGYIYCLDAYIEKVSPSRQIQQAYIMQQRWHFETLYLETNNFQGILKGSYQDKQEQYSAALRVIGVSQHHNKEKRISMLEPLITNGQLLFNEDLAPRLISQMQLFPTSNDDGPDALHGAVEQLRKRGGSITVSNPGFVLV